MFINTFLCQPHECSHCGSEVDPLGTHALSCQWSEGRRPCHAALNDIIHRSLTAANIPSRLEPSGLYWSDRKQPDGCSILPWRCGKILVWDATCPDTHAPSHVSAAVKGAGVVAAQAEVVESGQVRTPGHESPFRTFRGGNIWSVGGSSSGLHKRPQKGSLQSHRRAPQPRIPPAKNLGGGAERQRCCSSWVTGRRLNGWE